MRHLEGDALANFQSVGELGIVNLVGREAVEVELGILVAVPLKAIHASFKAVDLFERVLQ